MMPAARGMMHSAGAMSPVLRGMMHLAGGMSPLGRGMMRLGMVVMQAEVQETQTATVVMQFVMEMPPGRNGMSHLASGET